jgi:TRAP transporter 4TM/12TM fusion protein
MEKKNQINFFESVVLVFTIFGIGASIFHTFGFNLFGKVMWPRAYYALLIGLFMSQIFLKKGKKTSGTVLNIILFCLVVFTAAYSFFNANNVEYSGWEYRPPLSAMITAVFFCIVILVAVWRTGGLSFFIACIFFFLFPLFSFLLPGFLRGVKYTIWEMIAYYIYGTESVFGLVMSVMGNLLLGFMVFAVVLQKTGGGDFFLNIAFAIFGKRRGGPAKVAVLASGLFGSINGAPTVNVATTGAITIPAMIRLGYSPVYAGAIEACASTAGVLMPPVMGATAFLMCQVLGISYGQVIIAATVPAVLYYISLILQVDAYAVRENLVGLKKEEIPSLKETLLDGWPYLFAIVFLIFELLVVRIVSSAPYYASGLLIIAYFFKKRGKIREIPWKDMILETGKTIAFILTVLIGVGFIIGALTCTGVAYSFANEVIQLAGGVPILLLIFGAFVSFLLGMGLTISACYIFLAMTMAPPLVAVGYDPLAVHLFVMYYGMLSSITPPVALAAFTAAGISGASATKTGYTAMRIGLVLFILPFVFVTNPELILHGSLLKSMELIISFIAGILFFIGGTEGHILGVGNLMEKNKIWRIMSLITGILLFIPNLYTEIFGVIFAVILIFVIKKLDSKKIMAAG